MSGCDRDRHYRRSIRLRNWDYTQAGAYFVTICTYQRECMFGQVMDGRALLNEEGQMVEEEWRNTARLRSAVTLDAHVVMPNHVHGIIWIEYGAGDHAPVHGRGTARRAPRREQFGQPVAGSLPTIVRAFKSAVTKRINQDRGTPGGRVWQRNYYEHVIRSERALEAIRQYIGDNPVRWELDRYHPGVSQPDPQAVALWQLLQADR